MQFIQSAVIEVDTLTQYDKIRSRRPSHFKDQRGWLYGCGAPLPDLAEVPLYEASPSGRIQEHN